jgi:hypothetical protein
VGLFLAKADDTPITDWIVNASIPIAAGLAWGTLIGLLARLAAQPILQFIRGYEIDPEDVPSYGEFIAVCSAGGGVGLLMLWTLEYFGLL